jgi:hypothetical protein
MATKFSDIVDVALTTVQDYKLDNIYQTSPDDFATITNAFLLRGLPTFYKCKTPLTYDLDAGEFTNDLSIFEISILADLWVYQWFEWHVQKVTQFENSMTPNDFKHHSKAENLKQKSEYLDKIREKYSQKITNYCEQTANWTAMANGDFDV